MAVYQVAYIKEQGQAMVIVLVTTQFKSLSEADRSSFVINIQHAANHAGLKGRVAVVWDDGFQAPKEWHPFFQSITFSDVAASVNYQLTI